MTVNGQTKNVFSVHEGSINVCAVERSMVIIFTIMSRQLRFLFHFYQL